MVECIMQNETCGFSCTGFDGSHIWDQRMKITKTIECEVCRDHAVKNEIAFHDLTNLGLGKQAHDKSNWNRFVKEVNCVDGTCKKDQRC